MPLAPCTSCRRHVRIAEAACPFCDAALADLPLRPCQRQPIPHTLGLKRAFLYALGTGTLVLTSCESSTSPSQTSAAATQSEQDQPPSTEPEIEYELTWRSLTDAELTALVAPKPPPAPAAAKTIRVRAQRDTCQLDYNSDAMYGSCF